MTSLAVAPPTRILTIKDIQDLALELGLGSQGAQVAAAIFQTEGGMTGKVGDQSIGGSYGPFQFYTKGQLPAYAKAKGLSVQAAGEYARQNQIDAAKWALSGYLGDAIKQGMKQGLSGAQLATYAQQTGQRSKDPQRAGAVYQSLFGGKGSGTMGDRESPGHQPTNAWDTDPGVSPYTSALDAGASVAASSDMGGVDDSIARMYKQKQIEKKTVNDALLKWNGYLGKLKGNLGLTAGFAGFAKDSQDYADAVEEYTKAVSQVDNLKKQDAELTNDLQAIQARYLAAKSKYDSELFNMAGKAKKAGLQGQKDYLAEAVAQGKISTDQARLAWDEAQQTSDNWTTALSQAYSAAANLAPKMASQEDLDALWSEVNSGSSKTRYGGLKGPAPKVIPIQAILDPYMKQIAQYLPPAGSIDWKKAMTVPSGLGTPTISLEDYTAGAQGEVEQPTQIAPLPEGGYNTQIEMPPERQPGPTGPTGPVPGVPGLPSGADYNGGAGPIGTGSFGPMDFWMNQTGGEPTPDVDSEVVPSPALGAPQAQGPAAVDTNMPPPAPYRYGSSFTGDVSQGLGALSGAVESAPGAAGQAILGGLGAVGESFQRSGAANSIDPDILSAWLSQRKPSDPLHPPAGWRP